MAAKKFKNDVDYHNSLNEIEWGARVGHERYTEEMKERLMKARMLHRTTALDDALFLLKLIEEKVEEHNSQCKRQAGIMKTPYYKRNNIEGY